MGLPVNAPDTNPVIVAPDIDAFVMLAPYTFAFVKLAPVRDAFVKLTLGPIKYPEIVVKFVGNANGEPDN